MASAGDAGAQAAIVADQLPPGQDVSDTVIELAGWVVATHDNQGYPFAVIDKAAAQILVFGGDGRLRGAAPGLFLTLRSPEWPWNVRVGANSPNL